jgi:hypothetical protein
MKEILLKLIFYHDIFAKSLTLNLKLTLQSLLAFTDHPLREDDASDRDEPSNLVTLFVQPKKILLLYYMLY